MKHWKRNFTLYLIGQGITLFGSMLVYYAIMWHITLKTDSALMIALVTAAGALPMFFISPFAGVWADRYNKKLIINISDAVIALVTLGMAIIFTLDLDVMALMLVCLAVRALGQGVQMPAVNALIPELVPQERLTRVNGFSSGLQSFVMLVSPMAGGALLAVAEIEVLMFIDVVTAAIGISILVFFVKTPGSPIKKEHPGGAKQYFHEIAEGVAYIGKKPFLRKFLLLSAIFNFIIAPLVTLTPLQVSRVFGDGIWTVLDGLSFGPEQRLATIEVVFFIGMSLGSLLIGLWGGFKNRSHTMALSTFLLGFGSVALGLVTNFWIYMACMGLTGVVLNLFNPPMTATLQTNVDGAYMGRVFSVLAMMSSLMMPLGMVLWGPLGDAVEIGWLLIGTGIAIFFMGFVFIIDKTLLKAGLSAITDDTDSPLPPSV